MKAEELKEKGLTDDQIKFVMDEFEKESEKVTKAEDEAKKWKTQAETAEETLKKFEGIDPEGIQSELETWKEKVRTQEEDYKKELYERDFADALKTELAQYKFSSESARDAITAQIQKAGLKLTEGKIMGLSDMMATIKEKDPYAFVNESEEGKKAYFTSPTSGRGSGRGVETDPEKMNFEEYKKWRKENS